MRSALFLKYFLLFVSIESCNAGNPDANSNDVVIDSSLFTKTVTTDSFPACKLLTNITCLSDAGQSYSLYIPVKSAEAQMPIIYFFDPHGDGSLPLNKYKVLADSYGFILIGSNNSKNRNDWATEEHTWSTLFNDTQKRLKINKDRIYVCGFSGGAKAATYFALQHPVIKGVIANGAGLPEITQSGNFRFSFTAIAGEGDMNRSDLITINNALDKTNTRHRIIFFDGIHEWAPEDIMDIAFAGFQFDAMAEKQLPADTAFINAFISRSKKNVENLLRRNNYTGAVEVCKLSANMLNGLTEGINWFKEKEASLMNDPDYQRQFQSDRALQLKEQNIKSGFQQQFQQGDMNYWTKTINDITARAKTGGVEAAMYQRLKAFLSLAFYSYSIQLINNKQYTDAQHYVTLYKMADPSNSEAWYFSAILNAANNNGIRAVNDLMKAVSNGFNDKARLQQQPEFQQQDVAPQLAAIELKMK